MEASAVPLTAPTGAVGALSQRLLRVAPDDRLVALVRAGSGPAFELIYARHRRAILAFSRNVLGSQDEAEDVVQHTFLSAFRGITGSDKPIQLRAWLFTIARNRCYTIARARRELPMEQIGELRTDELAVEVQRRQDLRDLVGDLAALPADQRAALVLSQLSALSHTEIAEVLGVPREKVKALVFQARESLLASRIARDTDCLEIRAQLATMRGGALRRRNLRRHMRECEGCREFRRQVDRRPGRLSLILPVAGD